ncbi:hypothetical protein EDD18DRAFT_1440727 [Armillaria luteobubalina]|uniref:Uncharacterized protein n=1 Tax=Armillaria luteobubalina TaxID=153913 RepID=A0AA39P8C2_9AGAR|nr:hypothetical protein EDD18DRAFT_1440727 [Armillaria luteobubalina]
MLSYGEGRWIEQCQQEVLRLPLFEDPVSLSPSGAYVIAFHQSDCLRMIGLSIEGSARDVYDAMPTNLTKVLLDTRGYELLASFGPSSSTKQCKDEVLRLNALQSTTPLESATYIVAFHQRDRVRMLGFSQEQAARAVYSAISLEWANVLMNRQQSQPLQSYGDSYHVRQ